MKEMKFDDATVVSLTFAKKAKIYCFYVNSVVVFQIPEYMYDKKGFVWFARAAVRLFNCKN